MKHPISIYGSHDSSVCVKISADEYRVYELERITGVRHYSLNSDPNAIHVIEDIFRFIEKEHGYGFGSYSSLFYSECNKNTLDAIIHYFRPDHVEKMQHHFGHAACAIWESPFPEALIISFDGGGTDNEGNTFFNIFEGKKSDNSFKKIASLPLHICHAYTMVAQPLECIKKTGPESYLSWAGKIMGLVAYGTVRTEWIPYFKKYYQGNIDDKTLCQLYLDLGFDTGLLMNSVTDFQVQAEIAATSQHVFEMVFIDAVMPYILKSDLPVCITGGGALNVLLNQRMHDHLDSFNKQKMFVPCNPNDCGLALGFMLIRFPPDSGVMAPIAYAGFPLIRLSDSDLSDKMNIDGDGLSITKRKCGVGNLAMLLVDGLVIGFIQGSSEVGPRALGNRSILAYPSSKGVWDHLNEIKYREIFRPLSPVCIRENIGSFVSSPYDSQYMTYSQKVHEFLSSIAIAHNDGTARMQTVTRQENKVLYDLLEQVAECTGFGVLINTSFNSKGRPILTSVAEALDILRETDLDGVWIEGALYTKSERKIFRY
jgi:carbamoyltransferase